LSAGAGAILELIRAGRAQTRSQLVALTGLARSTVAQRVDELMDRRLVIPVRGGASTGGRPAGLLAFNGAAGAVVAVDLGAAHARLAVADLAGSVIAETFDEIDIADGPDRILPWVVERLDAMLAEAILEQSVVRAVGVGVPGPVEFATGRPVSPPIMPGWDRFPVAERLSEPFPGATVLVDNDVNIMAVGEAHARRETDELVFVKVGTGIGMGIVADGHVRRGVQGCAGDIGHIQTARHDDVLCRCGNHGCLEAVAGGAALAAALTEAGLPTGGTRDVVDHVRGGVPLAVQVVRSAGREIGAVLASVVNVLNPATVIVGGELAEVNEHLIAGIRENIYRRSTPLATSSLRVARSVAGERAGVLGAIALAIEHVLAPEAVDRELAAS
jgi:predicted NBD/HSP70 family sugar kinase